MKPWLETPHPHQKKDSHGESRKSVSGSEFKRTQEKWVISVGGGVSILSCQQTHRLKTKPARKTLKGPSCPRLTMEALPGFICTAGKPANPTFILQ